MNPARFLKMACGNLAELRELAVEFFNETRHQMTGWNSLVESGDFRQLREDLHRCKGGASLFGLERMVELLGSCENPAFLEAGGFDVPTFESELIAAENAVEAMKV